MVTNFGLSRAQFLNAEMQIHCKVDGINSLSLLMMGEGGSWNLVCRETNFWHLKKGREGWGTGRGIYTSIMQHIFINF